MPTFSQLIGDDFANLFAFEMTVRGKMKLELKTVGITCFAEQLPGLVRIVRIALYFRVVADPIRAQGTVHNSAVTVVDMLQHYIGIERIVDCLAHELIVEGLEGHVHPQEIHPKPNHLFYPIARVLADAFDVFNREIADNVRLTRQQSCNPRFLLYPLRILP